MSKKKLIIIALAVLVIGFGVSNMKSSCDHSFVTEITVAATCNHEGTRTSTCVKCGTVVTSSIPKLSTGAQERGINTVVYTNDDMKQLEGQTGETSKYDNPSGGGKTFGNNEKKHDSGTKTVEDEKQKDATAKKEMASRNALDPETAALLQNALAYITNQSSEGSGAENAGRPVASSGKRITFGDIASQESNFFGGRGKNGGAGSDSWYSLGFGYQHLVISQDVGRTGDAALDSC